MLLEYISVVVFKTCTVDANSSKANLSQLLTHYNLIKNGAGIGVMYIRWAEQETTVIFSTVKKYGW